MQYSHELRRGVCRWRHVLLVLLVTFLVVAACPTWLSLDNTREIRVRRSKRQAYHCGYIVRKFSKKVFPDYEFAILQGTPQRDFSAEDILLIGMHKKCVGAKMFPGKVIYVNGEARVGDMVPGSYYFGPTDSKSGAERAAQLYYISVAALNFEQDIFVHRPQNTKANYLLYISSRCEPMRERAFDALSAIAPATAGGSCQGYKATNITKKDISGIWSSRNTFEAYTEYMFGLVMENSNTKGYISEKIALAFAGGTVPIYYGTDEIFQIFNKDAFIYYTEERQNDVIAEIKYLMNDAVAYENKVRAPILKDGAGEHFFWQGDSQISAIRKSVGLQ